MIINNKNYNEFIKSLYIHQDLKYKEFHKKLIMTNDLIGLRTPIIKKIAKEISRHDYMSFIMANSHVLYEEKLLHGLLIGYIKADFLTILNLLDSFFPHIDNWALCDLTVSNLKIFNNNKEIGFKKIKTYLKNNNPWINRFGYVLLLTYYIEDKYIDSIFDLCKEYKDEYYVKMAIAWLISICYIKYKNKTIEYLKNNSLDKWTHNKCIQKIIESKRFNSAEKNMVRGLKKL